MATFEIEANYDCFLSATIELPEGQTPETIEGIWDKWGKATIEFKDGTEMEVELDGYDNVEYKRASLVTLYDEGFVEVFREE